MEVMTVKVNNVSLSATDHDLRDFFSFFGEIQYLELHRNETTQVAYVTFKEATGAETSILLSGATIADQPVTIEKAPEYKLPESVTSTLPADKTNVNAGYATPVVRKAEAVVTSMLAQGYIFGQDAISKAKAFDEKHQILSTATATVATLDQKIGFTEKLSAGTTRVNDKLKQIDERFQVTEKTKAAYSTAGSALKSNRFILTGAAWALGAYSGATQKANEVSQMTKEKIYADNDKNDNKAEDTKAEKEGTKVEGTQAEGNNAAAGSQGGGLKSMEGNQVESKKKEGGS